MDFSINPLIVTEDLRQSFVEYGQLFDVFLTVHHSIDFFKLPT